MTTSGKDSFGGTMYDGQKLDGEGVRNAEMARQ